MNIPETDTQPRYMLCDMCMEVLLTGMARGEGDPKPQDLIRYKEFIDTHYYHYDLCRDPCYQKFYNALLDSTRSITGLQSKNEIMQEYNRLISLPQNQEKRKLIIN